MNKLQNNNEDLPHIIYKGKDVLYLDFLIYDKDKHKNTRGYLVDDSEFSEILNMPLSICCSNSVYKDINSETYRKKLSKCNHSEPKRNSYMNRYVTEIFYLRHNRVNNRYILNFLRHQFPGDRELYKNAKNLMQQIETTIRLYSIYYAQKHKIKDYYDLVSELLPEDMKARQALDTYYKNGQTTFIDTYGSRDKYISERLGLKYNPSSMNTTHIEDTRPKIITSTTPFTPQKKEKQKYEFKTKIPDTYFKTIDAYKDGVDIDINLLNKLKQNKFTVINELFHYKAKIMNEAVFYMGRPEYDRSETELNRIYKYVDETNAKINTYINKLNED